MQRLDAVEDQEGPLLPYEKGEARAAVVGGAGLWIGVAEDAEGVMDEGLGGGGLVFRPLAVERPAEHARGAAPVVGSHAVEPPGDQGRLADASEGDEGEDVDGWIFPGGIEPGDLGLPADEMRTGDGQAAEVEEGGRGHGVFGDL
ncbi:MAG TPA: hypothetical protein VH988_18625 [Thermoanaerobaculia bacterium]|nr:hypothetical protein [Thermoanaerobaculia bacterium]